MLFSPTLPEQTFYEALLEYVMHAEHMLSNEHMLQRCFPNTINILTIWINVLRMCQANAKNMLTYAIKMLKYAKNMQSIY